MGVLVATYRYGSSCPRPSLRIGEILHRKTATGPICITLTPDSKPRSAPGPPWHSSPPELNQLLPEVHFHDVIEGACRQLVRERLDLTGARWGLEGAEAILKLRALRTNGDRQSHRSFHLSEERQRAHNPP